VAFIHGEVRWDGPRESVVRAVGEMLDAVSQLPWAATDHQVAQVGDTVCVVAAQRDRCEPRSTPETRRAAAMVAADVRLHERTELTTRLARAGVDVRGASDERAIELALAHLGPGSLDLVDGDGALAVWDDEATTLTCWRDPLGVRPLYYRHDPGRSFIFSSDLRAIAAHPAVDARLDLPYLRASLEAGGPGFQHPVRTLLAGVVKLPAGSTATVRRTGVTLRRHWRPEAIPERRYRDDRAYSEELSSLLRRAVASRIPDDEPLAAAHLSGGLDSTTIALLAREAMGRERSLLGVSWAPPPERFPSEQGDERELVELAARHGEVPVRYTDLRAEHIVDAVCRDVALRPTTTLHFELAASRVLASEGVRTILSGWGGDELAVYNGRGFFADKARRGHLWTVQRELGRRRAIHGGSLAGAWKFRVAMPLLPDRALRAVGWAPPPRPPQLPAELRPELREALEKCEPLTMTDLRERPGVRRMQLRLLAHGHLTYRTESWAAHGADIGVRYAFPLLDRRIAEFALSLPDDLYFRDGWKRWIFREAVAGILPDAVRWNPDKFDTAMGKQFQAVKPLTRDLYRERLSAHRDGPLIDVGPILSVLDRQDRGEPVDPSMRVGQATWLAFTSLST
jgi:asparagine synthase (glutamine-hydrolysing)